jgi:hypothetical protein
MCGRYRLTAKDSLPVNCTFGKTPAMALIAGVPVASEHCGAEAFKPRLFSCSSNSKTEDIVETVDGYELCCIKSGPVNKEEIPFVDS